MKRFIAVALVTILAFSTSVMAYEEEYSLEQLALSMTHSIVFDDEVSEFGYQGYKFVDENGNEVEPQYDDIMLFAALPSSYRNTNLTPVKDQKEEGCCWAFAMIGAMEASLIKQGYNPDELDFSEAHMAYFGVNIRDDIHNDGPVSIGVDAYSRGGNEICATSAMTKGSGAVSESVAPYDEYTKNTDLGKEAKPIDESKRFLSEAGLSEMKRISPLNNMAIKQAIINYGSVLNAFYYNASYYNKNTAAYHCPNNTEQNHQTLIVGWDDNYSRENFNSQNKPTNDGAWIVRNSWGEDYGDNGYFYISYETVEATISAVTAFLGKSYDNTYGYMGGYDYVYYTSQPKVYRSIFTADSDQMLESVSFRALSPEEATISVYKKTSDPSIIGKLVFRKTIEMTGQYHKVDFSEAIKINEGETYSIIIQGPVVFFEPNNDLHTSNSGKCRVYTDKWYDTAGDLSIRVYTSQDKPKTIAQIRDNKIEVESKYNDNATVYIAQYNDDNELIDIKVADSEATINTNATKYRIFSWDMSMNSTTGYFVEDEI